MIDQQAQAHTNENDCRRHDLNENLAKATEHQFKRFDAERQSDLTTAQRAGLDPDTVNPAFRREMELTNRLNSSASDDAGAAVGRTE